MSATRTPHEPLWDLVEESLDEAAFLWLRWEDDLASLTRDLHEVWTWTEDRLLGSLDGVRVGGDALIERALSEALSSNDPGRVSACANLAASGRLSAARETLAQALMAAEEPQFPALLRGVETADLDGSFAPIAAKLAAGGPEHCAALCRLKAFRRSRSGAELGAAFGSGIPRVQVEALRLAQVAPNGDVTKYVDAGLSSDDESVREAALDCGLTHRLPQAWAEAQRIVRERRPAAATALTRLAVLGGTEDHALIIRALRESALQRAGLFAVGYLGTREAVEICLTGMRDPKLSRGAGEAYCAITGADLERDHLAAPEPDDGPPPFEKDDLDADLVQRGPDLWPVPDLESVRRHWQAISSGFSPAVRYVRGRPASLVTLADAIEHGPMLRRPALIFELAVRTAGKYDVEPRAFTHVQRRMLSESRRALTHPAGH